MALPLEHSHIRGVFMAAKFRKKDWQNLTLMILDQKPCQLVPIWLTLSLQNETVVEFTIHCHTPL